MAWSLFGRNRDPTRDLGFGSSIASGQSRYYYNNGNDQSIVEAIYNKIAIDVANLRFEHVKLDAKGMYLATVNDDINQCITYEANIDQTGRALIQDIALSMMDGDGVVAVVPTRTDTNPDDGTFKVQEMRVAKILEWYPKYIKIRIYNDNTGMFEDRVVSKRMCAIIENPFYSVMNGNNSIMRRLVRKLNLIDVVDEQSGSGKLDVVIQLPYTAKTPARKEEAERRRKDIENQLANSKYGIAYTEGVEHITQLNRAAENNLLQSAEYLTKLMYSELGITAEIMNGTADEACMANYMSRTVSPIADAICTEFKRKFLSKNAITRGETITYFSNPLKLIAIGQAGDLFDKLSRNEILTGNELRATLGFLPSDDPNASKLLNKNINHPDENQNGSAQAQTGSTVSAPARKTPYTGSVNMNIPDLQTIVERSMSDNPIPKSTEESAVFNPDDWGPAPTIEELDAQPWPPED